MDKPNVTPYWTKVMRLTAALLCIWFVVSYGFGILLVEPLNEFSIYGFPIGFWFSQQGSIIVFVLLILAYCIFMDRLDREAAHEDEIQ